MEQNLTLWINLCPSGESRFTFVGILLDNFNPVIKKEEQRSLFCPPARNGCSSDEHRGLSLSSPAGCCSPALRFMTVPWRLFQQGTVLLRAGMSMENNLCHHMAPCGCAQDELFSLQGKAPQGLLMDTGHLLQGFSAILHHVENLKMLLNLFINFLWFLLACDEAWSECPYIYSRRWTCWTFLWTLLFLHISIPSGRETEVYFFPGCVFT